MWRNFWVFALAWTITKQSELFDLLSATDRFFGEIRPVDRESIQDIKLMVKRSHNLYDDQNHLRIFKRSVDYDEIVAEEKGVYLLSNIEDVGKIPAKFPNDVNVFSSGNLLLVAALEANATNPEIRLANDMVLYQYSLVHGIKEIGRVPVFGGIKTAIYSYRNSVYLIAAEHEASSSANSFEGSTLYKISDHRGRLSIEKVQILNVIQPNHVEFWEHQDEFYLAIGTNFGNDSMRSGALIYRWTGYHFDYIQRISSNMVKAVVPFTIGSFMYLAIANYQDEYGNTDILSNIYQFRLDDFKFHLHQNIETHGAQHVTHFKFEDEKSKKHEHFLAVANYIGKNSNGALTSFLESIVYKFNGNRFIPFQSFKLLGATQWLPIKGPKGEFLLLVAHSNGLRGYQYDGWRFSQVSLKFSQSALGENIQTMRTFSYHGDTFLIIADKSSFGEDVNLWKLSFKNQNDFNEKYSQVNVWCESMTSILHEDNATEAISKFRREAKFLPESKKINVGDLILSEAQTEVVRDIESLTQKAKEMSEELDEAENRVSSRDSEMYEIPIVIGSRLIPHLEIKCRSRSCVSFKNLQVNKVNGEDFGVFLEKTVAIDNSSLEDSGVVFQRVSVSEGLSSASVNGHPSGTLVDVFSETFLNSDLVINGTLFINNDFNVNGVFDGVKPDKNHLLLYDGDQLLDEKLIVDTLKVNNLKLTGNLNKHSIADLVRHPEMHLLNAYEELNINNLVVGGFLNEYKAQNLLNYALRKTGDQVIQGDLQVKTLEAKEIVVNSQQIYGSQIMEIVDSNPCLLVSPDEEPTGKNSKFRSNVALEENPKNTAEQTEKNVVIVVEGTLRATDVVDEAESVSLLGIISDSYNLSETAKWPNVKFSKVQVENIEAKVINGTRVESWILKNSPKISEIHGPKTFSTDFYVDHEVSAEQINRIHLEELSNSVMNLLQDELVPGNWLFDAITCDKLAVNFTNFGNESSGQVDRLSVKNFAEIDSLQAGSLVVKENVDNLAWNDILQDSIFDVDEHVESKKTFRGTIQVQNVDLKGRINDLLLDELTNLASNNGNTIILNKDVVLEDFLNVKELNFQGTVDSVLTPEFHQEWMLQGKRQTISVPLSFESIRLDSGSSLRNETVSDVNLRKLFSRSLKIDEDAKIKYLYVLEKMKAKEVEVGGTVNGADFMSSVVRTKGGQRQDMSGSWLFEEDLTTLGGFTVEGSVSGLNVTYLCQRKDSNGPGEMNLIVAGGLHFRKEPKIIQLNGINIVEKTKEIWMKNENTSLIGKRMRLGDVDLENESDLSGYLNDLNLIRISRQYLSKTISRVASADFSLENMRIGKWCRIRKANVGETVNGVDLNTWMEDVLLQEEDQTLEGKLTFSTFEASEVAFNGTVNRVNLSNEVLRYDVEDAMVEGEKTFESLRVLNLTIATGGKIQEVDVAAWKSDLFIPHGDSIFSGNLLLNDATFLKNVQVLGKVNDVSFDGKHLLNKKGNQVVAGVKHFRGSNGSHSTMKIRNLRFFGLVDGFDVDSLMKMQAYADRDLVFTEPQTFTKGFDAGLVQTEGGFQGVNVSEMCHHLHNPMNVTSLGKGFGDLAEKADALIQVARGRPFFFDYLESVQTLKPNVKAVVPTVDNRGHYLSVLTSNLMRFMSWNEYSENFVSAGDSLTLKDNITFVTSFVTGDDSFLYIEGTESVKIFASDRLQEISGKDTSCVVSFQLKPLNKSCIFIGYKHNSSRLLCTSHITGDLRTYQWLESRGSVQATALTVNDELYLAVINKEEIVDKFENSLTIYRFDPKLQHFYKSHTLAEVNPVALSSISYRGSHYLVSAGGHLPESVHNSVISIFRFNKNYKNFVRSKSIEVDTPVDVQFALLPSSELALYVLTSNPTKPLAVYLHRGIAGFVEETSGLSLYPGSNLFSFTDRRNQHFVVISGFGRGQILKAGFKGGQNA